MQFKKWLYATLFILVMVAMLFGPFGPFSPFMTTNETGLDSANSREPKQESTEIETNAPYPASQTSTSDRTNHAVKAGKNNANDSNRQKHDESEIASKLNIEKALGNMPADKLNEAEMIATIVNNSKNPSMRIRATAVTALGKSNSPEAVEPLIDAMLDSNQQVRERAVSAFQKLTGIKINKYHPGASTHSRKKAVYKLKELIPDLKARLAE